MVHFCLSLPCTKIRHMGKVLPAAVFCYGTKTKRPRISFIFMQVFSPRHSSSKAWLCTRLIENVDIQNRLLPIVQPCPTKKVLRKGPRERKTKTEPFVSFRYVSICSGEISLFRSLSRSVRFAPQCTSMLRYKDTIYNFEHKI